MTRADPAALRRARQRRPWRWAFALYALGLTTGTHWPELEFGPEIPASDKLVHFLAFGGLTYFLWRTGWIRFRWLLAVVGVLWTVVDEVTQGIPGLNRFITVEDVIASSLGVVTMTAWLWALRPVGADQSRRRHALAALAFDELFARPSTWMLFALHLGACIAPIVITRPFVSDDWTARAIVFSAAVWVVSVLALLHAMWTKEIARMRRQRACLACATPSARAAAAQDRREASGVPRGVAPGISGTSCTRCGAALRGADWQPSAFATNRGILQAAALPVALGLGFIVATAMIITASAYAYAYAVTADASVLPRAARFLGTLPPTLLRTIDCSACLVVLAIAASFYRRRLARQFDQGERCRHCGHDLAGTPVVDGAGRCGECGTPFTDAETLP